LAFPPPNILALEERDDVAALPVEKREDGPLVRLHQSVREYFISGTSTPRTLRAVLSVDHRACRRRRAYARRETAAYQRVTEATHRLAAVNHRVTFYVLGPHLGAEKAAQHTADAPSSAPRILTARP
jgi:hypothetical protein